MQDPIPHTFSRSGQSLFSVKEVRALMNIEFERAARYNYPVCLLLVQVDRLGDVGTYHGQEVKDQILSDVVELIRGQTRAGDLLGCLVEDRLLVMLPHTSPREVGYMLQRLLSAARKLRFGNGGRTQSITLSVGVSHNQHPDARNFQTLERVSEEGVAVAMAGGGDRFVETELYALHERKHGSGPESTTPSLAHVAQFGGEDYRNRLVQLMSTDGSLEQAAAALAEEIIARALSEARAEPVPAPVGIEDDKERAYQREIDNLQRRIAKLTQSLGVTEQEILRLQSMKDVDEGIASLYRNVQGLGGDSARAELKKDLMSAIFKANLDLQRRSG
ncbi:MAG: diguanylate cyclase [Planctomycetes bacterium]|nr:diguanylate cyclase [Planctomycetota bacterium]HRV81176.1 diguanylate cyclase [Planctomycetota bacterium]